MYYQKTYRFINHSNSKGLVSKCSNSISQSICVFTLFLMRFSSHYSHSHNSTYNAHTTIFSQTNLNKSDPRIALQLCQFVRT